MDILFFESMRVFKGEKGRVIFKLKLPKLSGEGSEVFNTLYSSLAEAYTNAADEISKVAIGDYRISVSFKAEEIQKKTGEKRIRKKSSKEHRSLLVQRETKMSVGGSERIYEILDEFNIDTGLFVK